MEYISKSRFTDVMKKTAEIAGYTAKEHRVKKNQCSYDGLEVWRRDDNIGAIINMDRAYEESRR